jgi:hypothetical protein
MTASKSMKMSSLASRHVLRMNGGRLGVGPVSNQDTPLARHRILSPNQRVPERLRTLQRSVWPISGAGPMKPRLGSLAVITTRCGIIEVVPASLHNGSVTAFVEGSNGALGLTTLRGDWVAM